ncbi:MAG: hypothetical protein IJW21_06185 [Clostridia bacterium]|nr:hypothetical protein [Clostridia bacterium]
MKKLTKVLALTVVLAMACLVLASCGLSGKYESKGILSTTTLEFKGDKVTITIGSLEAEGTYKIDGDEITITLDNADDGALSWGDALNGFNGTHAYEKDGDTIKIGGTKYTKAD